MSINANVANSISSHLSDGTTRAGFGALMGAIVSPVGAAGGALFGVTSYIVEKPVSWLCSKIEANGVNDNCLSGMIAINKYVLPFIASVIASMVAVSFVGFPIGFGSAVLLTAVADPDRFGVIAIGIVTVAFLVREFLFDTVFPRVLKPCMSNQAAEEARLLRDTERK